MVEFSSAHPVVLQQGGVSVLAARLFHKQFLTGGLVLVQHALPCVYHPAGGEKEMRQNESDRFNTMTLEKGRETQKHLKLRCSLSQTL